METLKPLIEELVQMVKSGKDIVSGNLPEVMKQIIAYETWSCLFFIKIALFVFMVGIIMVSLSLAIDKDAFSEHIAAILGTVLVLLSLTVLCVNYSKLKKIEMAPKVYMIDVLHGYISESE